MVVVLINATICAVPICFAQLKTVKLFVCVQVNSNLYPAMLRMAVFVTYMHAQQTMNVVMEFAAMVNVPWHAETKMIAAMVNIV